MVFHWSLSDSKSSQLARNISILAGLNNTVVCMVSIRPISNSPSPCTSVLVMLPSASITININVTFIFHSFFSSLARSMDLSLFSFSFSSTLRSVGTAKFNIRQASFPQDFTSSLANSLSLESEWQQISRYLLNILADLIKAVIWMISTFNSSSFSKPLRTVPNAPITTGITVTLMFHCFLSSLARSKYLSLFSPSLIFTLWSAWTAKFDVWKVLFFCC